MQALQLPELHGKWKRSIAACPVSIPDFQDVLALEREVS
jgi:hypothetical protein